MPPVQGGIQILNTTVGADPKTAHALFLRCLPTRACVQKHKRDSILKSVSNLRLWKMHKQSPVTSLTAASTRDQAWAPFMRDDPKTGARFTHALDSIIRYRAFGDEGSKAESFWVCWASMKASGLLDAYTQGKQKRDCWNARTSARRCEFNHDLVTSVITTERRQPRWDTNPRLRA